MSLDNVLAIAAIAKDNTLLLVLGLLISMPLIVAGSGIVMYIINRFPLLVWVGAALLGWVAGDMLLADPALTDFFDEALLRRLVTPMAAMGAVFVLGFGYLFRFLRKQQKTPSANG